ncbi:MAG: glycoside hydrolase family 3 protein, partial [Spirochaetaceae bacterium]|nr:glycoside hydrolase family 3 protein [Spirochaetaceae bacterium]
SLTPGNMALGADRLPYDAWMTGLFLGRELSAVGVNMNFAPTIDLFVNPKADVIGPRAFMANPEWTGILGLSFFKGQAESGIISSAKHFPGHGDTQVDSHGTLPVIHADIETLWNRDLIPYKTMIAGKVPAIMIGHLAFPAVTGNEVPATLSPQLITGLLKEKMGFQGVVVTDDLFMRGVRTNGDSLPDICYRALSAGADLLLVSQRLSDQKEILEYLNNRMKDNTFNLRVRDAARRVVIMKATYLKGPGAVPFHPDPENIMIPAQDARGFFLEQAARSITLVSGERFPIPPEEAGSVILAGSYDEFFREGLKRYPDAHRWRLDYSSTSSALRERGRELLWTAKNYDTVIVLLPDEDMSLLLNELEPIAEKVVVLSVLSPVHLEDLNWVKTSLAVYGTSPDCFRAAFSALAGDFTPEGILPIPLRSNP